MRCRVVIPISGGERIQTRPRFLGYPQSVLLRHSMLLSFRRMYRSLRYRKNRSAEKICSQRSVQKRLKLGHLASIPFNPMKHTKIFVTSCLACPMQWACGNLPNWNRLRNKKNSRSKDSITTSPSKIIPLAGRLKEFGGEDVGRANRISAAQNSWRRCLVAAAIAEEMKKLTSIQRSLTVISNHSRQNLALKVDPKKASTVFGDP